MGLFDMFGAGGGSLAVQLASVQVQSGGTVQGTVTFAPGKRGQNVTSIKARLVLETTTHQPGPNGPQPQKSTKDVAPEVTLSGPFQTTPGGAPAQFPFQFSIPSGVPGSAKGHVEYRVIASADIPGEIDPGASAELQVLAPRPQAPAMPQQGMAMPHAAMGVPGQPAWGVPVAPMAPPSLPQIGDSVIAQWQDGSWQPARVVAIQNGMFGVDWTDAKLGASTWVHAAQIQPALQKPVPLAPPPAGPLSVGQQVLAQWHDGQWHAARVVGLQNGMIAVDWADPKLGASAWVQAAQVRA